MHYHHWEFEQQQLNFPILEQVLLVNRLHLMLKQRHLVLLPFWKKIALVTRSFTAHLQIPTYAWQPDSAVRRISLMPTIYNFQEELNNTGIGQHHFLFDDIMEDLGSAMQVVSVIKLRQERRELGRTITLQDIKRAVLEVGERKGHFSPRWVRWCICNHFDMVDNILCPYYGCYRFKQFWPAPLFFVNTDQIPLPILY